MELFDRADHFLERAINQARPEVARAELLLARARLNLAPWVGTPETAVDLCEESAGSLLAGFSARPTGTS